MKTIFIYILAWLGMVLLAIVNGIIRGKSYGQSMSELSAHQLSTLIAIILFGIYIFTLTRVFQIQSTTQAFTIGGIWLIMTVIFEFLFGHFVAGHSWSRLFMDYNILNGRVWVLVLLWVFISPFVFYRV
ncbi:MAG: hypothetical protein AB4372_28885 [Xenococcus sp. (in: cyanobacteria)]